MNSKNERQGPHSVVRFARKVYMRGSRLICSAERPRVVQAGISGRQLLVLANEDVGRQIVFLRSYEAVDAEFMQKHILPTDICVDVGANTGFYTTLMASRAHLGEVHSFEPSKLNWHLLNGSVLLNEYSNVVTNQCALGAEVGVLEFEEAIDGAYSSFRSIGRKEHVKTTKVNVDTLDHYVKEKGLAQVDVLKIDVEGAENMVLSGASALFASPDRRPRVVLLELYDPMLQAFDSSRDVILDLMLGYGYEAFVARRNDKPKRVSSGASFTEYNVFFLQKK